MKRTTATIVTVSHHHMPEWADYPVEEGMTLRQALAALRSAGRDNFGDLGGKRMKRIEWIATVIGWFFAALFLIAVPVILKILADPSF